MGQGSLIAALVVSTACGVTADPVAPTPPSAAAPAAPLASAFTLLGGVRLASPYASEGLALLTDAEGQVTAIIAGAHRHEQALHRYALPDRVGAGDRVSEYPLLVPERTWAVRALFPSWPEGQSLRDVTVVRTADGYDLAGIGRVFYNTSPRADTRISIRALDARGDTTSMTRRIEVPLPEQEFTGFVKHLDPARDLETIGGGGYDSGQGSVAGISLARLDNGRWTRQLSPPSFADLSSPRLPRDAEYSCPDGASWVCLPPVNGRGIWSTEQVPSGGVRLGNTLLFIATLGYGPRSYARQSATFGDPALDRAVAYRFVIDPVTDAVAYLRHDHWTFAPPGRSVIGMGVGRWRGERRPVLFVVVANAWGDGASLDAPVLQLYRIERALLP
jgi:hypothetical protein